MTGSRPERWILTEVPSRQHLRWLRIRMNNISAWLSCYEPNTYYRIQGNAICGMGHLSYYLTLHGWNDVPVYTFEAALREGYLNG